jgi:hypothetical protein
MWICFIGDAAECPTCSSALDWRRGEGDGSADASSKWLGVLLVADRCSFGSVRDSFSNSNAKHWAHTPLALTGVSHLLYFLPQVLQMATVRQVLTTIASTYFGLAAGQTPAQKKTTASSFNGASNQHKLKLSNTLPEIRGNHFFLWPTISARSVRRSTRVRFFSIADVSNEMCGISQRYSAMNQIGFSVVIQCRSSNRERFTGRE